MKKILALIFFLLSHAGALAQDNFYQRKTLEL